jgi:glycosyltransferase 2 family protein
MIRRWMYWFLVLAFIWIVATRFNEITDFSFTLSQGRFKWVLIAVALQILHYLVSSASFRTAFAIVGVESRVRDLLPLLFGSVLVSVVAPSGGASCAALFVDHSARRGQSPGRTAAGVLLQHISSLAAFMLILSAGLVYLGTQRGLQLYQITAALILLLAVSLISGVLVLAMRYPLLFRRLLGQLQRAINALVCKFKDVTLITDDWVEVHASEFIEAGAAIIAQPRWLLTTLAVLLVAHLVNMGVLYSLFLAFSQSIQIGPLVAGYAIGILFLIISVTPQGVGVVEGIMPLTFASLGVPASAATITVLAFRGLSLWLPLLVGFLLLRRSGVFRT